MKTVIVIFTLSLWLPSFSQQETVFKVSAPKKITLTPDADTLLSGEDYFFQIQGMDVYDISNASFTGEGAGSALLKGSGISFTTTPCTCDTCCTWVMDTLRIYSKNNNSLNAVFEKVFYIFQIPDATRFALKGGKLPVYRPKKRQKFKYGTINSSAGK